MAAPSNKATIDKIEAQVRELRRDFDLYFQGIERLPPVDARDQMKALLLKSRREAARWSTGDRFRINSIQHKFTTYNQMWERQLQAMEDGTSRRDRMKVKLMRQREAEKAAIEATAKREQATGLAASGLAAAGLAAAGLAAAGQGAPQPPNAAAVSRPVARTARPAASADTGMSDAKLERLYKVYMQAKKRTGESTNMNYDSLARQIRKQIPVLKKKHGCNNVDFKVVLKNGKAMLKAVPK